MTAMTTARFKVGQIVCLKTAVRDAVAGRAASYKILGLLPQSGRDWSYRVKTILEPDARYAAQDELILLSALCDATITSLPERIGRG